MLSNRRVRFYVTETLRYIQCQIVQEQKKTRLTEISGACAKTRLRVISRDTALRLQARNARVRAIQSFQELRFNALVSSCYLNRSALCPLPSCKTNFLISRCFTFFQRR